MRSSVPILAFGATAFACCFYTTSGFTYPKLGVSLIFLSIATSVLHDLFYSTGRDALLARSWRIFLQNVSYMVPLVLLTVPIYYIYRYAAGFVSVLPTSGLVSLVLKSFGLPVSAKEDKVWVDVAGQVVPFLQSIEYFDLFFVSGFFLLTLLGWWITRLISLKSAALLVVSVIIYALFRYIVLVLIYSQFDEVYGSTYPSTIIIFYDAVWRVVSFVGLPIGLLFLKYKVSSADNPTSWKHSWISAFIGSLAACRT